jgi:GTP-binding protein Era
MSKNITIAMIGKPNVGKSTLFNAIIGKEIAFSSSKPNTTRRINEYVVKLGDCNLKLIDTPGIHEPKNEFDIIMNSRAKSVIKTANYIFFLVDGSRTIDDEDIRTVTILKKFGVEKNVFLLFTKNDISDKKIIENNKSKIFKYISPKFVNTISSNNKSSINSMLQFLTEDVSNNNIGNDENFIIDVNTENDNYYISEAIRKYIVLNTSQEIPYSTAVVVEDKKYFPDNKLFLINATIFVDKESQKSILIGSKGTMIEKVRVFATSELKKIFDCKIELHIYIKLKKD